jgi:hypothetical protein
MAEQTPVTLNQFAFVALTDAYWALDSAARRARLDAWLGAVRDAAEATFLYQVFPMDTKSDLLVWSAMRAGTPELPARFFDAFARTSPLDPRERHAMGIHQAVAVHEGALDAGDGPVHVRPRDLSHDLPLHEDIRVVPTQP